MKILIVDDSPKWVMWHESAVKEILGNNADIDKAFSASQGVEKLTADRKSTRLNSSHPSRSRMPSSA